MLIVDQGPRGYEARAARYQPLRTQVISYERLIMGEPETVEARSEKIEVQAAIEERIKVYAPVFQELLDERVPYASMVTPPC